MTAKEEKVSEKAENTPISEEVTNQPFETSDLWAIVILIAKKQVPDEIVPSYDPFKLTYHFGKESWEDYQSYILKRPIQVNAHDLVSAYASVKKNFRLFQR